MCSYLLNQRLPGVSQKGPMGQKIAHFTYITMRQRILQETDHTTGLAGALILEILKKSQSLNDLVKEVLEWIHLLL